MIKYIKFYMSKNMKHTPVYLYHITDCFKGNIWNAVPKIPISTEIEKDKISRICCSTNVECCISSICWPQTSTTSKKWYIYRTLNKISNSIKATKEVVDRNITKERWILNNEDFILVGEIKTSPYFIENPLVKNNYIPVYGNINLNLCRNYSLSISFDNRGNKNNFKYQRTLILKLQIVFKYFNIFKNKKEQEVNFKQRNINLE